jgi:hypothetical protein
MIGHARTMTNIKSITPLDERAVFCQADRCELVAEYLVVENGLESVCVAYCVEHVRRCARNTGTNLPDCLLTAS